MNLGRRFARNELVSRLYHLGWIDRPSEEAALRNVGDDELRAVLSIYQRSFGIKTGGLLDAETERSLADVRFCSHPDVMPMQTDLLKWPDGTVITWALIDPLPSRLSRAELEGAFRLATDQWMAVCGCRFEPAVNGKTTLLEILFGGIDGPAGTLAWSELANNQANPKKQRYDAEEAWVVAAQPGKFQIDLVRVACHEIGHALGLPHIAAGNLLQPTYDVNIRTPQAGDITEARARYGMPHADVQTPPADKLIVSIEIDGKIVGASLPGWTVRAA